MGAPHKPLIRPDLQAARPNTVVHSALADTTGSHSSLIPSRLPLWWSCTRFVGAIWQLIRVFMMYVCMCL
jgi:hypothetical protein